MRIFVIKIISLLVLYNAAFSMSKHAIRITNATKMVAFFKHHCIFHAHEDCPTICKAIEWRSADDVDMADKCLSYMVSLERVFLSDALYVAIKTAGYSRVYQGICEAFVQRICDVIANKYLIAVESSGEEDSAELAAWEEQKKTRACKNECFYNQRWAGHGV